MIDNDRYIPKVSQRQPPMLVVYVKSLKFLVRRAPGYAPEKSCDVQHVFLYKMLQNLPMRCSWIFPISRVLGTDSSYIYIWVVITVSCFVQLIPDKSSPADVASATTLLHSPDRSSAPWHHFTTQFFAVNNSQDLWPISMRFPRFKHQVVRHQNRWIKGFDFNICWWFLSPIKSAYFKKMTLTFRQRLRRRLVAPLTPHLPPSVASSPWLWKRCRRRRSVDRTPCQWDWRSSLAENYPLAIEHC